jgi:hypothetical protein
MAAKEDSPQMMRFNRSFRSLIAMFPREASTQIGLIHGDADVRANVLTPRRGDKGQMKDSRLFRSPVRLISR